MIEAEGPDGFVHEFPDGTSPDVIKRVIQNHYAKPAPPPPEPPDDRSFGERAVGMGRAVASGLRKGGEALVGLPGDAEELAGKGLEYMVGGDYQYPRMLPNTQEIHQGTTGVIGESYQPQGMAEEYADTIGEFGVGALAPGSWGARAARTLIPAGASETAGQLTKGTEAEPYARLAGALASVPAAMRVASAPSRLAREQAVRAGPSEAQLGRRVDNSYQTLRDADIRYELDDYRRAVAMARRDLQTYPRDNEVGRLMNTIEGEAKMRMPGDHGPSFDELELHRRAANDLAFAPSTTVKQSEREAALIIRDRLDDFRNRASMTSSAGGFPGDSWQARALRLVGRGGGMSRGQVTALQNEARELASRNIKHREIKGIRDAAEAVPNEHANIARAGLRAILKNKTRREGYSPGERRALQKAMRLTPLDAARLASGTIGQIAATTLGGAAGLSGGPLSSIASAVASGAAARMIRSVVEPMSDAQRSGRLNRAMAEIRAGQDVPQIQQGSKLVESLAAAESGSVKGRNPMAIELLPNGEIRMVPSGANLPVQ